VLEQGPGHLLWDTDGATTEASGAPLLAANEQGKEIVEFIFNAQKWAEDIALHLKLGFQG